MYSRFTLARKYLRYLLTAANGKGHGTHSPFVYSFIRDVLNDKAAYADYAVIEDLRKMLGQRTDELTVEDFGAGSVTGASSQRSVGSIAWNAAKPARYGQLLYRMARYYQPATILELGTSLGLSTAYLARGAAAARLITLEGSAAIAAEARKSLAGIECFNAEVITGPFDQTLNAALTSLNKVDLAFIDGNHREEPTIAYFEKLLSHIHGNSILIFDDIHWSEGMENAWQYISNHQAVRYSIDLFFIGIVFFREAFHEKQHFLIRW